MRNTTSSSLPFSSAPSHRGWSIFSRPNVAVGLIGCVLIILLSGILTWQLFSSGARRAHSYSAPADITEVSEPMPSPEMPSLTPPSPQRTPVASVSMTVAAAESVPEQQPNDGGASAPSVTPTESVQQGPRPLSDDVTKWTKQDYFRARSENPQKLAEGVAFLAEKFPHDKSTAEGLVQLLKSNKPEASADPNVQTPQAQPLPQQTVEAIIFALAQNQTEPAMTGIKKIISGELPVDDQRSAFEAAFRAIAAYPSSTGDQLIYAAVTKPDSIRSASASSSALPGSPSITTTDVRTKGLDAAKASTSISLRESLAAYVVQMGYISSSTHPLMTLLMQEEPANIAAQRVILMSDEATADVETKLLPFFINYSTTTFSLVLNVPIDASNASASGASDLQDNWSSSAATPTTPIRPKQTDFERGINLANAMWGDATTKFCLKSLSEVRGLDKQPQNVVFSTTVPQDSVRESLCKALKKRALDGPQQLDQAGWTEKVLGDPALVPILKTLPRRDPKNKASTGATRTSRFGRSTTGGAGAGVGGTEQSQKKEQIEADWYNASLKLSQTWCARLDAGAQNVKRAIRRGQKVLEQPPTKLDDFELPKDAKVLSAFQINWPDNAPAELADLKLSMLKVQYFHLEQETGMMRKTIAALRKSMKNAELRQLEGGAWFDSLTKTGAKTAGKPTQGTLRSLDVFVTRTDKQPVDFTAKDEEASLDIQILAVEVVDPSFEKKPDPASKTAKTSAASAEK